MSVTEEMTPVYARHVGERLRNIRRQQGLSLQAVEEQSEREFKASVLGAYERGERIISVLRLQRLARLYGVPVDQLLPKMSPEPDFGSDSRAPSGPEGSPITIDLSRLERLDRRDACRDESPSFSRRCKARARRMRREAAAGRSLVRLPGFDLLLGSFLPPKITVPPHIILRAMPGGARAVEFCPEDAGGRENADEQSKNIS